MTIHLELIPLISILAGVLILIRPKILSLVVGVYLIAVGVIQLLGIHI